MIKFIKPENLNGDELLLELNAAGVTITQSPILDGNNNLWLDINEVDKAKASAVLSAHNGTMAAPAATIAQKLASVGLSVDDLKAALGL
jgi:hypothetical protein